MGWRRIKTNACCLLFAAACAAACTDASIPDTCGEVSSADRSLLTVVMDPQWESCEVKSSVDCSILECGCPTSKGCSRWFGKMTGQNGSSCTISLHCRTDDGTYYNGVRQFPGGSSCDLPAPVNIFVDSPSSLRQIAASFSELRECKNVQIIRLGSADDSVLMWDPPPTLTPRPS
jgi:hypothetical protein